ncbi:MAG: heptaprenyl diphosphate synthase, partial [Sphaerochaeta sp.]
PRLKGKLGALLLMSLSYFSILTACFRTVKGTFLQRVDGALFCGAEGKELEARSNQVKESSSLLIIITTMLVVGVSLASRFF